MVKRTITATLVSILLAAAVATQASALGLGVYLEGGGGEVQWDFDDPFLDDQDGSLGRVEGGLVLDTAVASNVLFNYRLSVGYGALTVDWDDLGEDLELQGIVVANSFGFGIYRSPALRLWVGPQLRLAYYEGDFEDSGFDVKIAQVGIGPVVGCNWHLGETFTFSLSAGVLATGYGGEDDWGNDIEGDGAEVFANLAVLFRLAGDRH